MQTFAARLAYTHNIPSPLFVLVLQMSLRIAIAGGTGNVGGIIAKGKFRATSIAAVWESVSAPSQAAAVARHQTNCSTCCLVLLTVVAVLALKGHQIILG